MKIKNNYIFFIFLFFVFTMKAMEEVEDITQGVEELSLEGNVFEFICDCVQALEQRKKLNFDIKALPQKVQEYISFIKNRYVVADGEKYTVRPYLRSDLLTYEFLRELEVNEKIGSEGFNALDVEIFDGLLKRTMTCICKEMPENNYLYNFLQYAIKHRAPLIIIQKILEYYPDTKARVQKLNNAWMRCTKNEMIQDTNKTAETLAKEHKREDVLALLNHEK